jgi:O-antigen ligase
MWLYHNRPAVVTKLVTFAGIGVLGLCVVLSTFSGVASRLAEKFEGIIDPSEDVTASWRMEGWRQQLTTLVQEGDLLFGEGVGGYYHWYFNTQTWTSVPHNAYVQIVLKFGLVGLTLYGLLALEFFRKTLAVRKKLRPGPMRACIEMGILNFGAAHAFMLGYGFDPIILIFFAVATSAANLSQQAFLRSRESGVRRFPQDLKIPSGRFRRHGRPEARPLYF